MNNQLSSLKQIIQNVDTLLIYAGAGMSVEIGNQPYWAGENSKYGGTTTKYGLTPLQHATEEIWLTNPTEQAAYVQEIREQFTTNLNQSKQNLYTELLNTINNRNIDYHIVTSNVDDAFSYYGYEPAKIYEKHGNYFYTQCSEDHTHTVTRSNSETSCPECGALLRPNVLMFGDTKFSTAREVQQWYAYDDHLEETRTNKTKTLILEIGVGTTILNIRDLATKAYYTLETAPYIHVNPIKENINNYSQLALLTSKPKPTSKELWVQATGAELTRTLKTSSLSS